MESEQPTSERRALIKAAGKRLEGKPENRYDFFFIVLTFTSERKMKQL